MSNFDLFKEGDKHASVGFVRSDGDFELLATFNNGGDFVDDDDFFIIVTKAIADFNTLGAFDDVIAIVREDALDIVVFDKE